MIYKLHCEKHKRIAKLETTSFHCKKPLEIGEVKTLKSRTRTCLIRPVQYALNVY